MHQDELRKLIREAIAHELGPDAGRRSLAREPREEMVSIGSDAELAAFARRLLDIADDPKIRDDIRAGHLKFKLASVANHQRAEVKQVRPAPPFVTERWVDALPEGTTVIAIGKRTKLTPLARDRLRSKNIKIERAEQ
jgi:hypothetical protein